MFLIKKVRVFNFFHSQYYAFRRLFSTKFSIILSIFKSNTISLPGKNRFCIVNMQTISFCFLFWIKNNWFKILKKTHKSIIYIITFSLLEHLWFYTISISIVRIEYNSYLKEIFYYSTYTIVYRIPLIHLFCINPSPHAHF